VGKWETRSVFQGGFTAVFSSAASSGELCRASVIQRGVRTVMVVIPPPKMQLTPPDPLWVDRIKAAVDAALAAKGWTQVESGGDISIVAIEINRDQQTLNTFYDNFGGGFGRRGFGGFGGFGEATTTPETYTVGTLVVDLFDAKTKNLVWRGVSSGMLSNKSDKNIENLNKGVQKLFQHFPPDALKNS
jgi:Domain of unknown function (DUF4136)